MKQKSHIPLPVEYATKPRAIDGIKVLAIMAVIALIVVASVAEVWL